MVELPAGQRAIRGLPRFGVDLSHPPPTPPRGMSIDVSGELTRRVVLGQDELGDLPRREVLAGLHCVAGWSAVGLRWEGVAFRDVYHRLIEPALAEGAPVRYVVLVGLDGYRSIVVLGDALAANVLIADRLLPPEPEHPARAADRPAAPPSQGGPGGAAPVPAVVAGSPGLPSTGPPASRAAGVIRAGDAPSRP